MATPVRASGPLLITLPDGVRIRVGSDHRTLSTYLNSFIAGGFRWNDDLTIGHSVPPSVFEPRSSNLAAPWAGNSLRASASGTHEVLARDTVGESQEAHQDDNHRSVPTTKLVAIIALANGPSSWVG